MNPESRLPTLLPSMDISCVTSETMASLVRLIETFSKLNDGPSSVRFVLMSFLHLDIAQSRCQLAHGMDLQPCSPNPLICQFQLNSLRGLLRRAEKEVNASENALLPVNRLPPEILLHIFRLVILQQKIVSRSSSNTSVRIGDIWSIMEPVPDRAATIISVCRRWRSAALADPGLWTVISDRQDRRPLTIAGQSRAAFELRLLATPSHAVRELLESEGHRVRAIQWDKANVRPIDLSVLATPGCRLEKLVLGMSLHSPTISASMFTPILHTQTAYLRWLTLHDCNVLPGTSLPNLTGLHLDGYPGPGASRALCSLLACAPKLTDLVLSRITLADGPTDFRAHAPLPLPSLRRLVFADGVSPESIAGFLAHVELPVSLSLRVHADPVFAGLARTPAFRDATDAYFTSERSDVILTGPSAAVYCVQQDALHVLSHVSALTRVWLLGEGLQKCGGVPSLPRSVRNVVVRDVGLAVVLDALQRSASSANAELEQVCSQLGCHDRRPEQTTVNVLMTSFMSMNIVLAKLARLAEAQTTHVVVGCLPTYKGGRACPRGFESTFASLEIKDLAEEPRPTLPDVCMKTEHCLWPAWLQ